MNNVGNGEKIKEIITTYARAHNRLLLVADTTVSNKAKAIYDKITTFDVKENDPQYIELVMLWLEELRSLIIEAVKAMRNDLYDKKSSENQAELEFIIPIF